MDEVIKGESAEQNLKLPSCSIISKLDYCIVKN